MATEAGGRQNGAAGIDAAHPPDDRMGHAVQHAVTKAGSPGTVPAA